MHEKAGGSRRAPLRGYLDTCLVSGLAKRDLRAAEHAALRQLLALRKGGRIELVTSHVTREEIARIPAPAREMHEDVYALLADVPAIEETTPDSGLLLMGVGGGLREDPTLGALRSLLRDEGDARHVFQAIGNSVDYFVTDDERTILAHATELERDFGVKARLPSDLVSELVTVTTRCPLQSGS